MKHFVYAMAIVMLATGCKKNSATDEAITSTSQKESTSNARRATTIQFSGYTWNVRNSTGGPGPNTFSGTNAWVDASGRLHLKIAKNPTTGQWSCAEIYSTQNFGIGSYQWQVEGAIDKFDRNIVLGLFNYSGRNEFDEMDIEFARWGNNAWPNLNYTVWPAASGYSTWSYSKNFSLSGTYTTQRFTRSLNSVVFKSMGGFYNDDTNLFETATCTSPTSSISTSAMPVHMNLWLYGGNAPSDGNEVEIIIHNFKFTAA
jgi:hypothetical protein